MKTATSIYDNGGYPTCLVSASVVYFAMAILRIMSGKKGNPTLLY